MHAIPQRSNFAYFVIHIRIKSQMIMEVTFEINLIVNDWTIFEFTKFKNMKKYAIAVE